MSGGLATLSIAEADAFACLRAFLLFYLDPTIEVIRGEGNLAAEPTLTDFIVMTQIGRQRLSTNHTWFNDPYKIGIQAIGNRYDLRPTQISIQLDIHGPRSADTLQIIESLFRSDLCASFFHTLNVGITPLYGDEPRQAPFINAENQYEFRWTIDLNLQVNPIVGTPQQFAQALNVGLINVDAVFPPNAPALAGAIAASHIGSVAIQ